MLFTCHFTFGTFLAAVDLMRISCSNGELCPLITFNFLSKLTSLRSDRLSSSKVGSHIACRMTESNCEMIGKKRTYIYIYIYMKSKPLSSSLLLSKDNDDGYIRGRCLKNSIFRYSNNFAITPSRSAWKM